MVAANKTLYNTSCLTGKDLPSVPVLWKAAKRDFGHCFSCFDNLLSRPEETEIVIKGIRGHYSTHKKQPLCSLYLSIKL